MAADCGLETWNYSALEDEGLVQASDAGRHGESRREGTAGGLDAKTQRPTSPFLRGHAAGRGVAAEQSVDGATDHTAK